MRAEEQCNASERFLFADEYFSDNAVTIWQNECIKRCTDKPKGESYYKYINWKREENQIAIFTLYAYADFEIPKKFDCIFRLDSPKDFIEIEYELSQSIHEAWFPLDTVDHGHKHLCIFTFKDKVPDMIYLLHKGENKFYTSIPNPILLGFCQMTDLKYIMERREKMNQLKTLYGTDWWKYDEDN